MLFLSTPHLYTNINNSLNPTSLLLNSHHWQLENNIIIFLTSTSISDEIYNTLRLHHSPAHSGVCSAKK